MFEALPGDPLYGPWLTGTRPKRSSPMGMSGGIEKRTTPTEHTPRCTWFDIMNEVRDPRKKSKEETSNNGRSVEVERMDDEVETRKQHNVSR